MTNTNNNHEELRLRLYKKLSQAEALEANGDPGISHEEMMARLKKITYLSLSE